MDKRKIPERKEITDLISVMKLRRKKLKAFLLAPTTLKVIGNGFYDKNLEEKEK